MNSLTFNQTKRLRFYAALAALLFSLLEVFNFTWTRNTIFTIITSILLIIYAITIGLNILVMKNTNQIAIDESAKENLAKAGEDTTAGLFLLTVIGLMIVYIVNTPIILTKELIFVIHLLIMVLSDGLYLYHEHTYN